MQVEIAKRCHRKLISSMGAAKRTDPTQIRVCNIFQEMRDGFTRKIRRQLNEASFSQDYTVISSMQKPQSRLKGSFVAVTGAFGLVMAAEAVRQLQKGRDHEA